MNIADIVEPALPWQPGPAGGTGATPLQNLLDKIPIWEDGPAAGGTIPEALPGQSYTNAILHNTAGEWNMAYRFQNSDIWQYSENHRMVSQRNWSEVDRWLILK